MTWLARSYCPAAARRCSAPGDGRDKLSAIMDSHKDGHPVTPPGRTPGRAAMGVTLDYHRDGTNQAGKAGAAAHHPCCEPEVRPTSGAGSCACIRLCRAIRACLL